MSHLFVSNARTKKLFYMRAGICDIFLGSTSTEANSANCEIYQYSSHGCWIGKAGEYTRDDSKVIPQYMKMSVLQICHLHITNP